MYPIIRRESFSETTFLWEVHAPDVAQSAQPGHFVMLRLYDGGERIPLTVADYVEACAEDQAFARVVEQFERASHPLLAAGAEVLIPAGGLPSLVLSRRRGLEVEGAAVLNAVPVLAKHGEAAVALARVGLPVASRKGAFALASERCRQEFLAALA